MVSAADKPAPVVVGIATWLGYGPGYIAQEKGWFGELPVEFKVMDDWGLREQAFASGKIDIMATTVDTVAISASKGIKGPIFIVTDESAGADGIVATPEIKSGADLKGKKVAYTRSSISQFFLIHYLAQSGLSMNHIQRVEVDDPGRAGEAFVAGSVPVAVTWEPMITQILKTGKGRVLATTKTVPHLIVDVLQASPQMAAQRKADLQNFTNAWLKAIDFVKTNPKEAHAIMAKHFKIAENEVPDMVAGIYFTDQKINRDWLLSPADSKSKAMKIFETASKVWLQEKVIRQPASAKDFFTSEFIENAR